MEIIRLNSWHWPELGEARFYGWRHTITVGPFMIFLGRMSAADMDEYCDYSAKHYERKNP